MGFVNVDVMEAVQEFHYSGRWPKGTNTSIVTLIPKMEK